MIYIAYIVLAFTVYQLITASINLIFIQKAPKNNHINDDLVSLLIPARNEEKNIANILSDIQKLNYKKLEIIVFNDQSTDRTPEIVDEFAAKDPRIMLINSTGLPEGWLGKNFACHTLSIAAKGKYLFFIDADVRLNHNIIQSTVGYLKSKKLGLLSVFPKQIMISKGEKLTVPLMNYILLSLLPLIFVRISPYTSHSAANGQFMLFDAQIYNNLFPHEKYKSSPFEDIEISRYFKRNKIKVACMVGDDRIKCRMYESYKEAVNGFAKNVLQFFGNSIPTAALFWIITTLGFLPFLFISIKLLLLYIGMFLIARIMVSISSEQSITENLIYFVPQQFSLMLFIIKAVSYKLKRNYLWKGRNIPRI